MTAPNKLTCRVEVIDPQITGYLWSMDDPLCPFICLFNINIFLCIDPSSWTTTGCARWLHCALPPRGNIVVAVEPVPGSLVCFLCSFSSHSEWNAFFLRFG